MPSFTAAARRLSPSPRLRFPKALALAILVAVSGCAAHYGGPLSGMTRADFRRPSEIPSPVANPQSPEKVALGKHLFNDKRLSGTGTVACASCHDSAQGFEDGQPLAVGVRGAVGTRNTPTLWNLAWSDRFFWDGRAGSLEDQALAPIRNPKEMDRDLGELTRILQEDPTMAVRFAAAFPEAPSVSPDSIAKALAAFERTLVSPQTPFDRWVAGDEQAISPAAQRGFDLFAGKAGCARCHAGWNLTDGRLHDIGLAQRGTAKTPTLRDLSRRAPYMHDGSLPTLDAVLDHYAKPAKGAEIQAVTLTQAERLDLITFLGTLEH